MSEFNKYARRMDAIVRAALNAYIEAATREKEAEAGKLTYPRKPGADAAYTAKSARAETEYIEAVQGRKDARHKMDEGEYRQQINQLRAELQAAVNKAFSVDPDQIDNATLELLKSGVCTPDEYGALLDKAAAAGNATMARLIGKYAEDAAAAALEAAGGWMGDPTATALRGVTYKARSFNGKQWLDAFDYMVNVYDGACHEPAALANLERWDALTSECIDEF